MRLDEWQKYIEAQFLDDEPEPVKAPEPVYERAWSPPVVAIEPPALTSDAPLKPLFSLPFEEPENAAAVETVAASSAPIPMPEAPTARSLAFAAPAVEEPEAKLTPKAETAPKQEAAHAVVAPPVASTPVADDYPAFLLLKPTGQSEPHPEPTAPEPASEPPGKKKKSPRFGSQAIAIHPVLMPPANAEDTVRAAHAVIQTPKPAADSTPAPLVQAAPLETLPDAASALSFGPLPDASTEIPSFASYLPGLREQSHVEHAAYGENGTMPPVVPDNGVSAGARRYSNVASVTTLSLEIAEMQSADEEPMTQEPEQHETLSDATYPAPAEAYTPAPASLLDARRGPRFRTRHARSAPPQTVAPPPPVTELWASVPRHFQTLLALEREEEAKEVAQTSYKRTFQETRLELIERLLDPVLSLEETARLLNVCPTTVRRYTNKGILNSSRKEPSKSNRAPSTSEKETRQRRFRLSDILLFLETQHTALETDRAEERRAAQRQAANSASDETVRPAVHVSSVYTTPPHEAAQSAAERETLFPITADGTDQNR